MSKRGSLAMRHARAVLDAEGAVYHCAGQRVVWTLRDGERVPFSVGEDILGCFDILALLPNGRAALVQVTTDSSTSKVRLRQRKIDATVPFLSVISFTVWAWVKGKYFRRWERVEGAWVEQEQWRSPLLKSRAVCPVPVHGADGRALGVEWEETEART